MFDEKGKLTRGSAIQIIQSGGSVLMDGKLFTRIENLPGEAEFAKGDKKAEEDARARLQKVAEDARAELAKLDADHKGSVAAVEAPKPQKPAKKEEKPGVVSKQDLVAAIEEE